MGGGWSMPCPSRLTPRNDPVPIVRRLEGPQGRAGLVYKILPLPGFNPQTVQPLVSHYTNYAVPAHNEMVILNVS